MFSTQYRLAYGLWASSGSAFNTDILFYSREQTGKTDGALQV